MFIVPLMFPVGRYDAYNLTLPEALSVCGNICAAVTVLILELDGITITNEDVVIPVLL
jgi:hypothetical protein